MEDQFRVWVTFENGTEHLDTDWCSVEELGESLRRLVQCPAQKHLTEIKVIDMLDTIVFLHQDGKQVFPEIED